jgi:hypothetical protein
MKYPAILIGKDGSIEVIDEPMKSCSWLGFKNGYFNDLLMFDSNGESWKVDEVVIIGKPSFIDKTFNRKLNIKLSLNGPIKYNINNIAAKLCECVDKDPGDLYCQYVEHEVLKSLFRSSVNPSMLINHARNLGSDIKI